MRKTWSKMICALDCRYHKLYLTAKSTSNAGGGGGGRSIEVGQF